MMMTEQGLTAVDELKWIVGSRACSHMSATFLDLVPLDAQIPVTLEAIFVLNATQRGPVPLIVQSPGASWKKMNCIGLFHARDVYFSCQNCSPMMRVMFQDVMCHTMPRGRTTPVSCAHQVSHWYVRNSISYLCTVPVNSSFHEYRVGVCSGDCGRTTRSHAGSSRTNSPDVEVLNGKNSVHYVIDSLPHRLRRISHLESFLKEAAEIPRKFSKTGRFLYRGGILLWLHKQYATQRDTIPLPDNLVAKRIKKPAEDGKRSVIVYRVPFWYELENFEDFFGEELP